MTRDIKSTIKQTSDIDFSKELVIKKLIADKKIIDLHYEKLSKIWKDAPPAKIQEKIQNIIIRDNVFNVAMNEIANHFKIDYDKDEVKKIAIEYKKIVGQDRDDQFCEKIAEKIIAKTLIFAVLGKMWNLTVSDKEVQDALLNYYKISNEPIREYEQDKNKFENIRSVILEEKISNKIVESFKHRFELEKNKP